MSDVMDRELVVSVPDSDALSVFTVAGKIKPFLDRAEKFAADFRKEIPDVSTAAGRKRIISAARAITSAKTSLEAIGKKLAADQKEIPKKIDATRREIDDVLSKLAAEVRKPVTDWEEAEKERLDGIAANLRELEMTIADTQERPLLILRERLNEVIREQITEKHYGDSVPGAEVLKARAIEVLKARIDKQEKAEAEAIELAALRREKEAREAIEKEADAAAEREREKARQLQEMTDRALATAAKEIEAAEKRARDAEAKAAADLKAQQDAAARDQAKREADTKHRAAINREALAAIIELTALDEEIAKALIVRIARREIPHISINY